jgi:hypothetical protein
MMAKKEMSMSVELGSGLRDAHKSPPSRASRGCTSGRCESSEDALAPTRRLKIGRMWKICMSFLRQVVMQMHRAETKRGFSLCLEVVFIDAAHGIRHQMIN